MSTLVAAAFLVAVAPKAGRPGRFCPSRPANVPRYDLVLV